MNTDTIHKIDRSHIWHPYTQEKVYHEKRPPLIIDRSYEHFLVDTEGKEYYDGNGSWWVNVIGHSHPELLKVMNEQAQKLAHVSMAGIMHEPAARLAEKLMPHAPTGLQRVFFSDNGSTAVEVALKMAYHSFQILGKTEKTKFLSLNGAFHGETIGCVSLGGHALFHEKYGKLLFDCERVPSPAKVGTEKGIAAVREILEKESEKICAMIVEPLVQGVAGMKMYEPKYLRLLRSLCDEFDVLLIADEVFTGLGRTGKFWAVDHAEITPDFICSSKAITGGILPFAFTLVTEKIYDNFYGDKKDAFYYGHTFTGNPLGCAIGCKVLDLIESEMPSLDAKINTFAAELKQFENLPKVKEVRNQGLIGAVELEGDSYLDEIGWLVYDKALERGLYSRPLGNVLYLLPMLTMSQSHIKEMVSRLYASAKEVVKE